MTDTWIAVDWGTSSLRAYRMEGDRVTDEVRSDKGMSGLARSDFEPALLDLVGKWLGDDPMTVVACGMVGSRQGWVEAPYAAVPAKALSRALARPSVSDQRLDVHVIPGLKQTDPADVMRGEETQIAGYLADNPGFDGVICLPGTHTKWAIISAEEVVSFRTFMTGEMFALLSKSSVLRHSIGSGFDAEAFEAALSDTLSRPESLAARLFGIRASSLLEDLPPDAARARLSGALIGAELAGARPYWLGQSVAIIGDPALSDLYAQALALQGVEARIVDARQATTKGLAAARSTLKETAK